MATGPLAALDNEETGPLARLQIHSMAIQLMYTFVFYICVLRTLDYELQSERFMCLSLVTIMTYYDT